MRKVFFLVLGVIAISVLSIILATQYLNNEREKKFVYPNSELDIKGEYTSAWNDIHQNINIQLYWGVNYKVSFYTTTSSLEDVIAYYDNSLGGKIIKMDYYSKYNATWIYWQNFRDAMILTYTPTTIDGNFSLVIERIWPMAWWKYLFGMS